MNPDDPVERLRLELEAREAITSIFAPHLAGIEATVERDLPAGWLAGIVLAIPITSLPSGWTFALITRSEARPAVLEAARRAIEVEDDERRRLGGRRG